MIVGVGIYVRKGKAYIPTQGRLESGIYIAIEPIYEADLNKENIVSAVKAVIASGHPKIESSPGKPYQQGKDPVLKAIGVKSWKELAKGGTSDTLYWQENEITLFISKLDKKGRFEVDPNKTQLFPTDTPLENIVQVILDDVNSRCDLEW